MLPEHRSLSDTIKMNDLECFLDLSGEEAAERRWVDVEQNGALACKDKVDIVVMSVLFNNMDPFLKDGPFKVLFAHLLDEWRVHLSEARHHPV